MRPHTTDLLTEGLKNALSAAGLPAGGDIFWEVPRDERHGDYATNAAMTLARAARQPPRKVAEAIVAHFPRSAAVERLEIAGPGFVNVFLSPAWCARALGDILSQGATYGGAEAGTGERYLLEFVSANPTGPLVIVNARAAAVGDALARILRFQGHTVETQYYVNDAGNQFHALARSFVVRLRQALGEAVELPEGSYPGEYLVDLAADYLKRDPDERARPPRPARARADRGGRSPRRGAHGGGPASGARRLRHPVRPLVPRGRRRACGGAAGACHRGVDRGGPYL